MSEICLELKGDMEMHDIMQVELLVQIQKYLTSYRKVVEELCSLEILFQFIQVINTDTLELLPKSLEMVLKLLIKTEQMVHMDMEDMTIEYREGRMDIPISSAGLAQKIIHSGVAMWLNEFLMHSKNHIYRIIAPRKSGIEVIQHKLQLVLK